jgi:hypothetical protein
MSLINNPFFKIIYFEVRKKLYITSYEFLLTNEAPDYINTST